MSSMTEYQKSLLDDLSYKKIIIMDHKQLQLVGAFIGMNNCCKCEPKFLSKEDVKAKKDTLLKFGNAGKGLEFRITDHEFIIK